MDLIYLIYPSFGSICDFIILDFWSIFPPIYLYLDLSLENLQKQDGVTSIFDILCLSFSFLQNNLSHAFSPMVFFNTIALTIPNPASV